MSLIRKLPADSALARAESGPWANWDAHKENTARLLEIESYKLQLAWLDRTSDPDDPATKRERALAKRAGIKPPAHPMVPPVAMRPRDLAEQRLDEYNAQVAAYQVKSPPAISSVSRKQFDQSHGFET